MKYLALPLFALITSCAVPRDTAYPSIQDSFDSTAALVRANGSAYCAGAFYRHYVITANHCVRNATAEATILISMHRYFDPDKDTFWASRKYSVRVHDEDHDLAILEPLEPTVGLHSSFRLGTKPYVGQWLRAIGHPHGIGYTFTEGQMVNPSRTHDYIPSMTFALTNIRVYPGNSGGPLLNTRGELIGICSFYLVNTPQLSGFVDWRAIVSLLTEEGL